MEADKALDRKHRILSLPADWWRNPAIACALANLYHHHLLPLHFGYRSEGKESYVVATGFLLKYRGQAFWITAGHVLGKLKELIAHPKVEVGGVVWFDGMLPGDAAMIRDELSTLQSAWIDEQEMDVGVVVLRPYYLRQIEANPAATFLDEGIWSGGDVANVEGHYVVGFPGEWQESTPVYQRRSESAWTFTNATVCLPVARVPDRGRQSPTDTFWGYSKAIYGTVHDGPIEGGKSVANIEGMSGGPLFGIARTPDGDVRYCLVGVQSCWLPTSRILRASPISGLKSFLDSSLATSEP